MKKPCLVEEGYDTSTFDCGNEVLNGFLKQFALHTQKSGSGRTYVALGGNTVIGYYTIASASVLQAESPERVKGGMPRHPIPAVILGRFAVDKQYQGRGIGKSLLMDALQRIAKVSEEIGIRVIIADAKDQQAKAFYLRYDFTAFSEDSMRLYLLLKDLKKTLAS